MTANTVVQMDKDMSPEVIQNRINSLRRDWTKLNETALQVLELAQKFLDDGIYEKAYVFTVLAHSYIVAPK